MIYRLEQRAENASGRGLLLEKHVVATPPETSPLDFGQAVRDEAMRRGLARAQTVYLVMDGAVWLWKLAEDRFKTAVKTLELLVYHYTLAPQDTVIQQNHEQLRDARRPTVADPFGIPFDARGCIP